MASLQAPALSIRESLGWRLGGLGSSVRSNLLPLGYELFWRVRRNLFGRAQGRARVWDGVSASGLVASAMAGLLLGLDRERLAHALAIGGAQTYTLSQVRRGQISMLKGAANALAAHGGALGALLAAEGMSGPFELFEGTSGLLRGLDLEASTSLRQALVGPIDRWRILDISIKLYPAVATSQSAIAATLRLVADHGLTAEEVGRVEVHAPDTEATHEHLSLEPRRNPQTRETADHSVPFLLAVAIEDGDVGPAQFRDDRWLQPRTRALMSRVSVVPDAALNAYTDTAYPAVVYVYTRDGRHLSQEMLHVPGSPTLPLSDAELGAKLRRLAGAGWERDHLDALQSCLLRMSDVPDVREVGELLQRAP